MRNVIEDIKKWSAEAPFELPGLGRLSMDEWEKLPADVKGYAYYVFDTAQAGVEEPMSFNEWAQQTEPATAIQLWEYGQENKEFMDWLTKTYKPSGATRITLGEKLEELEAKEELKGRLYFSTPKGYAKDREGYLESDEVSNQIFYAKDPTRERARLAEEWTERKIKSSGGKILSKRLDKNDYVWKVKWPDGKISEVRYAAKFD